MFFQIQGLSPEKVMLTSPKDLIIIWSFSQQMDPGKLGYKSEYYLFNEDYTLTESFLKGLEENNKDTISE